MLELFAILAPIALIDSTSITPLALVPLISILAGKRPYRHRLRLPGWASLFPIWSWPWVSCSG